MQSDERNHDPHFRKGMEVGLNGRKRLSISRALSLPRARAKRGKREKREKREKPSVECAVQGAAKVCQLQLVTTTINTTVLKTMGAEYAPISRALFVIAPK